MGNYNTKQRRALLDFLEEHADTSLSVREISASLEDKNISTSAVYRNLALLEEEGRIRRVAGSTSRDNYYQYVANDCKNHLHLSCRECGKTFHADNEITHKLVETLAENEDFEFDSSECVLFGVCGECRKNKKNNISEK